ncbi:MAG: gamma-glutamyl-gamma-aminobutyrate hydrolase family protein [Actinobacteria bacterium]|jgi:putative glutamine amidotransferase|nr:MAG: gamma-glutamyl-gamma-aminobutyrate hydrolase family protein [Actinomycetota bacterium]
MAGTRPLVALPGRCADSAAGLRTEVVAAGARYATAVERAAGQPVVLPPFVESDDDTMYARARFVLSRVDALVMLGGADIDPARYGAPRHAETGGVDPRQDAFEFALVRAAISDDVPVLAICRGMQVLNVVRGGTLVQHLPDDPSAGPHRKVHHDVRLVAGSLVAGAVGATDLCGYSVHHQAVDGIGDGLRVTGHAADGTIEAIELDHGWVVGVQWHPEDTANDDVHQSALFEALVARALRRA